jgi:hypothetical protein
MRRYFIGLLVVAGLLILLIMLIVSGGSKSKTTPNTVIPRTLVSYADTNASVSMEVDGPINAQELHNDFIITISSSNATIEAIQGYNGAVIKSTSYPNTEAAYTAFLHALSFAGFARGSTASDLSSEAGYCSLGDRYIFELQQNGTNLQRFWTTTCSNDPHKTNT